MVTRVVQPSSGRPLLKEDGSPSVQLNSWFKAITQGAVIVGTGSPEDVIQATQGAVYLDETGIVGAILYIKRDADVAGDETKGWILV